jgi:hypothetical protein
MSDPIERAREVVRAQRYEVVDEGGQLRALLGDLGSPDPDYQSFGLTLFDPSGRRRLWLALDTTGPNLGFDYQGNTVLTFGVNDAAPDALHVGAYWQAADSNGTTVLGWRIEDDGSVTARLGGPTR